jgi:hypothetical protein
MRRQRADLERRYKVVHGREGVKGQAERVGQRRSCRMIQAMMMVEAEGEAWYSARLL